MRAVTLKDLADMGSKRFHEFVAAVVLAEHPEAEPLGGKDGGLDVLLERRPGKPKGWQSKHFAGSIRWQHCVKSLDDAVEHHGPSEVVFVFPKDLGTEPKETFDEKLRSRHPEVDVSYVAGSQLLRKLRNLEPQVRDDLIGEFFGSDLRDQARAVAEHLGSRGLQVTRRPEADMVSEHFELADAAGRRDRYFRTEVAVTTGDVPAPVWEENPAMLFTHSGSDRGLRIAIWPEKDRDPREIEYGFAAGELGERARRELRWMLASEGEAELPPGASARLKNVPEAIRAVSDIDELESVSVKPTHTHPARLTAELDGERLERTLPLVPVPPLNGSTEGELYEFGCLDGALALFLTYRPDGDTLAISIQLDLHVLAGHDLPDLLAAARLALACDEGSGELEIPSLGPIGPTSLGGPEDREQRIAEHRSAVRLFESLLTIRDALGIELEISESVPPEQAEAAMIAAGVVENGTGYFAFERFGGELDLSEIEDLEQHEAGASIIRFPASIEVLGQQVDLGIGEAEMPAPSSVTTEPGSDPSKRQVVFHWDGETSVPFRIVSRPGAPPPEIGIWLPGEQPPLPEA